MTSSGANADHCPVCGARSIGVLDLRDVVVHCNVLCSTREQAQQVPRADMSLRACATCGHLFNAAFDASMTSYGQRYENALDFSPRFRSYADALSDDLVSRYDLHGKTIVEIGCGRGEFLRGLCARGSNRGIGYDPSLAEARTELDRSVLLVRGDFATDAARLAPNLVCCRHVLEHIGRPRDFLAVLRGAIPDGTDSVAIFFEVPNGLATLRDLAIWDLIYEHVSYFNRASLARCFTTTGFDVRAVEPAFNSQFLCVHALAGSAGRPSSLGLETDAAEAVRLAEAFAARYLAKIEHLRSVVNAIEPGRRVIVWGAGSKGVTFLNILGSSVECAVDINPRKRGMFVAGSGHEIVAPEDLPSGTPLTVLVMNDIYRDEISQTLLDLGISAELARA